MYNEDYLMHYGVKGMKWGIRRNNRIIENATRNATVRKARQDHKSGKISSYQKKQIIRTANAKKNAQLAYKREVLKGITDDKQLKYMLKQAKERADASSSLSKIIKAAHITNHAITGASIGSATVLAAAALGSAIANPTLGLTLSSKMIINSVACQTAVQAGIGALAGAGYLSGKAIDKLT